MSIIKACHVQKITDVNLEKLKDFGRIMTILRSTVITALLILMSFHALSCERDLKQGIVSTGSPRCITWHLEL